jgi:pimeloyl-ACP methyl ester carboxylesterase
LRLALDAPDRVAGLMLIRPSWLDRPALPHLGIVDRVGRWQLQVPQEAGARLEEDSEFQEMRQANPGAAQSVRGLLTRPQAQEAAAVLGAMVADRPFHRLGELAAVTCKCLVVANDDDPLHPVRVATEIAEALPAARLCLIPSRYRSPAEHFPALRAAVQQFLDQLGES